MTKLLKNISKETQLVDWEEIKAWATFETRWHDSILRNYSHLFEEVKEEEKKEEKVVEEKPAKKSTKK